MIAPGPRDFIKQRLSCVGMIKNCLITFRYSFSRSRSRSRTR